MILLHVQIYHIRNIDAMPLKLYPAVPADAIRISEIHMAAFASNAMLLAQFRTPEVREGLRESVRLKALADISDPRITVLVVRDISLGPDAPSGTTSQSNGIILGEPKTEEAQAGRVIAFAKWSHPVSKNEDYEETPWIWPPGTNMEILESWGKVTEEMQGQAVGDEPCYRLTFMGTDPQYERRGAASMMVRWGLERCLERNIPGYLESTLDAAPFYERMGFTVFKKMSLRYRVEGESEHEVYEEIAFVHRPNAAS
ncbi:putative GNAT family acetyltransferase [Nemania sp. NC0429]|nr:putative GNAT family acetyltransferase [Nemania sp. NC0429]